MQLQFVFDLEIVGGEAAQTTAEMIENIGAKMLSDLGKWDSQDGLITAKGLAKRGGTFQRLFQIILIKIVVPRQIGQLSVFIPGQRNSSELSFNFQFIG